MNPIRDPHPPAALPATGLPAAAAILPAPRRDRLLILPVVAIALIVLLTGSLLGLVARDRAAEARQKLTTDALWVEQYLRFQLSTYERELAGLAHDLGRAEAAQLLAGTGALMRESHPEIVALTLVDTGGGVLARDPPGGGGEGGHVPWARALAEPALIVGRAVHGPPRADGTDMVTDVAMPAHGPQGQPQVLAMTISLDQLLALNVPWWIAGRYHVALTDAGGAALATRSTIAAPADAPAHTIAFDPPLPGTFVTLTSFQSRAGLGQSALVAAIAGLLALVVVSLAIVARQGRHRATAEHALRAEHAFRKAMEESLTIGMRARARDGTVIYVNPEFCRMVGRPESDIVGLKPPHAYWAPEIVDEGMARHQRLLASGPVPQRFETRFQRPDGSRVDALVYEAPLIGPDGAHLGWMGSVIDITDRKRAESLRAKEAERLQHSARLVTLGEMASTLAHELNQPLAAIAGYAAGSRNLLASGAAGAAELAPTLQKLEVQAQRAGAILHRVQDFARKRPSRLVSVDLGQVLATSVKFIEDDARARGVPIHLDLPDGAVRLAADPVLIEQAVLNLVRNALDALASQSVPAPEVRVSLSADDSQAHIRVADNGPGISAESLADLFAPFHTTKPEGLGLGLSICRSIVELHRGRLGYHPGAGGRGSLFVMTLPLSEPEPAP